MSAASDASNVRVFVKFKEDTVFAGEYIECTITFKSLEPAKPSRQASRQLQTSGARANNLGRTPDPLDHLRAARVPTRPALSTTQASIASNNAEPVSKGPPGVHHRHTASMSVVDTTWKNSQPPYSPASPGTGLHGADLSGKRKHERTISIVSLDSTEGTQKMRTLASVNNASQSRPGFKHGRSASMQQYPLPNAHSKSGRPNSLGGARSMGQKSPLAETTISPSKLTDSGDSNYGMPLMRRTSEVNTPFSAAAPTPSPLRSTPRPSPASYHSFKFPASSPSQQQTFPDAPAQDSRPIPIRSRSPRSPNGKLFSGSSLTGSVAPVGRVFSVQSMDGTPRSSTEIYSTSNHSDETMVSELPAQPSSRLMPRPFYGRSTSAQARIPKIQAETLMMGYVQIQGSFTLDGSLVNQSPFEEVKRKAVVGGQGGGGVVGINKPSEENSLFKSFNWGGIGQSIGSLLGSGELSSIKEMKGIADSRSIPLISTSKSILFVDLRLSPGQSKSYAYRFRLPRGLPPSHRGRAMKVAYRLIVGTQRPATQNNRQQKIKQVEIPFRVFGSVNGQGEPLGHDLMSPYVILKDQANIVTVEPEDLASLTPTTVIADPTRKSIFPSVSGTSAASSADDFQNYVNHLLSKLDQNISGFGLLSPTMDADLNNDMPRELHRTLSDTNSITAADRTSSPRILIEQAIRSSMHSTSSSHTPMNFTIARSSVPIATLTLSRPALKLGDSLVISVDFSSARLPSYAIEATLESAERVDPALAIRNPQSIERATRRVWARTVENTQWAKRTTISWQVPSSATPGFSTTGVGLEWCVRLEMVVGPGQAEYVENVGDEDTDTLSEVTTEGSVASASSPSRPQSKDNARQTKELIRIENTRKFERLLEVISEDERGTIFSAVQRLGCESFEVTIPIRVFGAVIAGKEDFLDAPDDGLPI